MAALHYDNEVLQMYYALISEDVEWSLPWPLQPNQLFDLDIIVSHLVAWPNELRVNFVDITTDEFEGDSASAVFSMWRLQEAQPLGGNKTILDARIPCEITLRIPRNS